VTDLTDKGLIHVYYGDGKGKTSAALGLALRASGSGKKVTVVQFLKDSASGELSQLELLPNVAVLRGKDPSKMFAFDMDDAARAVTKRIHDENLARASALARDGACDALILDEALDALDLGLLDADAFSELLRNKPSPLELVITGHRPADWITELADYVTEMRKIKHPYDRGIKGRRGIEF
jgi:cob(I)alamin adenosyltransferase